MAYVETGLPIVLVVLAFSLKLLIDRTVTFALLIHALLELPIDVAFLANSFVVAFTISTTGKTQQGLFVFAIYIIGSMAVVFLWRRSSRLFDDEKLRPALILAAINFILCITGLVIAVGMVR